VGFGGWGAGGWGLAPPPHPPIPNPQSPIPNPQLIDKMLKFNKKILIYKNIFSILNNYEYY